MMKADRSTTVSHHPRPWGWVLGALIVAVITGGAIAARVRRAGAGPAAPTTPVIAPAVVTPTADPGTLDRPFDATVDQRSYNCAGFAFRNYKQVGPEDFYAALSNFRELKSPDEACPPGWVRLWVWEYDVHHETETGQVEPSRRDAHIVAGRCDPVTGAPPAMVFCKFNRGPVQGPAAPESWAPPARELTGENKYGVKVYVIRDHMTLRHFCAPPDAMPK